MNFAGQVSSPTNLASFQRFPIKSGSLVCKRNIARNAGGRGISLTESVARFNKGRPQIGSSRTSESQKPRNVRQDAAVSADMSSLSTGSTGISPKKGKLDWFDMAVVSVLWPGGMVKNLNHKSKELAAYFSMARPINLVPSFLLVFLGAWVGTGKSVAALGLGTVWVTAMLSSGVAVASVVVNDYFDYAVDRINAPEKPIPSGLIPPDGALLLSSAIYISVLIAACCMEPALLRNIVAASAAATLLYTPLLKKMTLVKNMTVAAVIGASPVAGALAAGGGTAGLHAVAAPCAFLFLSILYREILMDINDTEGDSEAGVYTLPVVLGRMRAFLVATAFFTAAAAMAAGVAVQGGGLAVLWTAWPIPEMSVRALGLAAVASIVKPVFQAAISIYRNGLPVQEISAAIDASLKYIGLGMLLIVALM